MKAGIGYNAPTSIRQQVFKAVKLAIPEGITLNIHPENERTYLYLKKCLSSLPMCTTLHSDWRRVYLSEYKPHRPVFIDLWKEFYTEDWSETIESLQDNNICTVLIGSHLWPYYLSDRYLKIDDINSLSKDNKPVKRHTMLKNVKSRQLKAF